MGVGTAAFMRADCVNQGHGGESNEGHRPAILHRGAHPIGSVTCGSLRLPVSRRRFGLEYETPQR